MAGAAPGGVLGAGIQNPRAISLEHREAVVKGVGDHWAILEWGYRPAPALAQAFQLALALPPGTGDPLALALDMAVARV